MKKTLLLLLALAFALMAQAQKIAVLSDIHVTPGNACDSALRVAVQEINAQPFDIVIVNGDLSNEGSDEQLSNVKSILDSLAHPLFIVPGNHENNWSQSATKTFVDLWGADRFSATLDSLLIVGINCGPYMKMGDGHIKQEDLHWLRATLDSQLKPGMKVLSFCHYPIRENDLDNFKDYDAVLADYPVVAHINGHYHSWIAYQTPSGINSAMTRALEMKRQGDHSFGYAIIEISPSWISIYDKPLGQQAVPMFAFPNRVTAKKSKNEDTAIWEMPQGFDVQLVWADSASVFTRLGFDNDRVYFGTSTGMAKAVDCRTGQLAWQQPLGAAIFSRPVALKSGKVAFTHAQGIAIFDASTGSLSKDFPSSEGPYVADGLVNGNSYYQGGYKRFEARDAKTGKQKWTFGDIHNYCQAAPAIDGNDIVFGAWDTRLRCLDARSGRLRWEWSNGKAANMLGPGNVVPVLTDSTVVIVAPDRYMTALDRRTGQQLWRDNSHRYRESLGHSADHRVAYAKTMDGELVAVDASAPQFTELWTLDLRLGYEHAPCIILEADGVIYVGSRRGIVTAVGAPTAANPVPSILWQLPLGSSEINGFDLAPDGSIWCSLIEGSIFRLKKNF